MGRRAVTPEELECTREWAAEAMRGAANWASRRKDDQFARRFNAARSKTARADAVADELELCPRYFRQILSGTRAMSRATFLKAARMSYELEWTEVHHHPDVLEFRYRPGRRGPSYSQPIRPADRKRLNIKRRTARFIAARLVALGAISPPARRWRVTGQRILAKAPRWYERHVDSALKTLAKGIAEVSQPPGAQIALVKLPGLDEDLGGFSRGTRIALGEAIKWRGMEWQVTMTPVG